jgi:hydrogenase maturation protease
MNGSIDGAGKVKPGIIKIIGVGQSLRGDDAAGLSAVRVWVETFHAESLPRGVQIELAELPGIELLNMLDGTCCAIVVDAVQSGARPGTIHRLTEDQLESFGGGSSSAHGWGVAETLSLGRLIAPTNLPPELILIGIEASQFSIGEVLSPEVQSSLPEVAGLIEEFVSATLLHYQN